MWTDIDYMQDYRDFTYDPLKFEGLPEFIEELHAKHMKYVPIIDAGISRRPYQGYEAYLDGHNTSAYIEINGQNGLDEFVGQVWPNDAVYPDFFKESGISFWQKWLTNMHKTI